MFGEYGDILLGASLALGASWLVSWREHKRQRTVAAEEMLSSKRVDVFSAHVKLLKARADFQMFLEHLTSCKEAGSEHGLAEADSYRSFLIVDEPTVELSTSELALLLEAGDPEAVPKLIMLFDLLKSCRRMMDELNARHSSLTEHRFNVAGPVGGLDGERARLQIPISQMPLFEIRKGEINNLFLGLIEQLKEVLELSEKYTKRYMTAVNSIDGLRLTEEGVLNSCSS